MKKIAFIIEDFSDKGGRETVLATLANALCEYYDIHILCVTQKNDQIAYSLNSNIHYQYFTYFEGRTRERFARSVFKMRKYIKKHHIDCVIGVGSSTFMLCTIGTVFSKTKFIGCEHSNLKNTFYDPLERLSQRMGAIFSNQLITLTKKDIGNWIEKFPFVKDKIDYCYNPSEIEEYKESYDMNSKKIISLGRISGVKQFHLIPQIASQVFEKHPDWSWDIYGDGDKNTVQLVLDEIKNYHMEDKVRLMGAIANPHIIYGKYSLFVLCSKFEGLPIVLLEAKQHHLPIVAFDIQTGPSDIVQDQVSGLLVEAYDCKQMAEAICKLIEQPDMRETFSNHALDNMHLFDKEVIIEKWRKLLD